MVGCPFKLVALPVTSFPILSCVPFFHFPVPRTYLLVPRSRPLPRFSNDPLTQFTGE